MLITIKSESRSRLRCLMMLGILLASQKQPAFAQVNPDNTLPSNSQVTQQGNSYNITGGSQAGNNLFHSFEKFSVPTGGEAYFNNAVDIQNIISRVTGKSISDINGLIRANGTANLFLINPNGIVFGENARFDIGGSFIGSTADSFQFDDGKEFSAVNPEEKPLLSINVPLGLQYGKNQTGNITNSGNLSVNNGKNITLVGNSFENIGELKTDGGQISIAAIAEGFASLGKSGELLSLEFQPEIVSGNVNNFGVINKGRIDASIQAGIGGKIVVLGKRIGLLGNSLFNVSGIAGGGEVKVGDNNTIAAYIDPNASIKADALTTGDGGKITVSATESTRAYGSFSAKGGLNNGNGGFVATSGSNFLDITGINVDTNANNGLNGNWLLNSGNILFGSSDIKSTANDTVLDISTIEKQLSAGNNITIAASETGSEVGNITADRINIKAQNNSPVTLTLQADNDITLSQGNIQSTNNRLGMVLQADNDGNGKGNINLGNGSPKSFEIDTKGEKFTASADSILFSGAEIWSKNTGVNDSEDIAIATANDFKIENSVIFKEELGLGNSGDINIEANDSIVVKSAGIVQETGNASNGGDINIKADSLSIQIEGGIDNNTTSYGDAGNINIKVNFLSVKKGGISSITDSNGNAGLINIETDRLDVNGAQIQSITEGVGNAKGITINANSVSLQDGGFSTSTQGNGNAGKILVNAIDKIFIGNKGALASDSNGIGNAGEIILDTGSLILENAFIASSTIKLKSQANAGQIELIADSIVLNNSNIIANATSSEGNAGDITLRANDRITLKNGSIIDTSANENSIGNAGNIIVEAKSILFDNETKFRNDNPDRINSIGSITRDKGNAGEIKIDAEEIILRNQSGIAIDTKNQGNAGKLTINTSLLQLENSRVKDNAGINSSSSGSGEAGEITINADRILLDKSDIEAQTESGDGGNINLNLKEFLVLRNGSRISTTAGTINAGGNGGNITIDAPNGFIVAIPNENSDITANAFEGKGGNIQINASGIFGIQFREQPTQQTSDISASSELGIDGTVEISTPDLNPSNELVELPSIPINTKLAQGCYSPGYAQNQFFIVGRGGLPPLAEDFLTPSAVRVDWVSPRLFSENIPNSNIEIKTTTEKPKRIVEATGWIVNKKGEIIFTADAPVATADNSMQQTKKCELVRE